MPIKIVKEQIFISNDDFLIDKLINEVNEGIGDNIQSIVNKISDKKKALLNLIKRFNAESNSYNRKRLAKILVILFLSIYSGEKIYHGVISNDNKTSLINSISNENEISIDKIINYVKELINGKEEIKKAPAIEKYFSVDTLKTSDVAKNTIKKFEKLVLKGYKIKGDGKITIGWGHAEPIRKSKYKRGQVISKQLAEDLFVIDIKKAEDGVKRMFSQWKAEGNDIKITQGMFDAMVSIAFNAGVTGLRTSSFIQLVKAKKFNDAHNEIINVRNTGKFGGLDIRRKAEQELYKM